MLTTTYTCDNCGKNISETRPLALMRDIAIAVNLEVPRLARMRGSK